MRYHFTSVRMAIIKKSTKNKFQGGCGKKGTVLHCWWEYNLIQSLWKTIWKFLKKLAIKPPYDLVFPHLGKCPEEPKIAKYTCISLLIAALFTIARTWKQPRCPSTDEWIKKLWYTYTMKYYSAIKSNTFESAVMRWMNLESIVQSEVSQKDNLKNIVLNNLFTGSNGKTDIENRLMDMWRGEERVRCMERVMWKLTLPYVK